MSPIRIAAIAALAPLALGQEPPSAPAEEPSSGGGWASELKDALADGRMWVDLNYRVGYFNEDNFGKNAYPSTLRTVLGYETATYKGFKGLLEFENVSGIGNDLYNSTQNGVTDRPIEADPIGTSVNQAILDWGGLDKTNVRGGREELKLDNVRWIGNVAWRQKHQTYEGANIRTKALGNFDLFYSYVDQVNNVTRRAVDVNTHLANFAYSFENLGRLTAYGYYLDFQDNPDASSLSVGMRFAGKRDLNDSTALLYQAEFANQQDAADSSVERDANYFLLNLGVETGIVTLKLGGESLGGDGTPGSALQTPLSTLHAHNGWADRFLLTPDTGLRDYSLYGGVPVGEVDLALILHDFHADTGGAHYGSEVDFQALWDFTEHGTVGAKLAYYDADEFNFDTLRSWLWVHYSF